MAHQRFVLSLTALLLAFIYPLSHTEATDKMLHKYSNYFTITCEKADGTINEIRTLRKALIERPEEKDDSDFEDLGSPTFLFQGPFTNAWPLGPVLLVQYDNEGYRFYDPFPLVKKPSPLGSSRNSQPFTVFMNRNITVVVGDKLHLFDTVTKKPLPGSPLDLSEDALVGDILVTNDYIVLIYEGGTIVYYDFDQLTKITTLAWTYKMEGPDTLSAPAFIQIDRTLVLRSKDRFSLIALDLQPKLNVLWDVDPFEIEIREIKSQIGERIYLHFGLDLNGNNYFAIYDKNGFEEDSYLPKDFIQRSDNVSQNSYFDDDEVPSPSSSADSWVWVQGKKAG